MNSLVKLGERHRPAPSQGGEVFAVLELSRELEGRDANVLDLLNGHVGMEGGDGVPAALVTDADVDARLADTEAHEGLAFLQDVVAGLRGGRLAESILDDGRIDPGDGREYGASVRLLVCQAVGGGSQRAGLRHISLSEERLFYLTLRASSDAGLPTGRYARLLLAHLWTEAVRGETPEILLAPSWYHLCALLDIHNTGGAHGTCRQIRKQLRRLADLRLEVRRHEGSPHIPPGPENMTLLASLPLAAASDLPVEGKAVGSRSFGLS